MFVAVTFYAGRDLAARDICGGTSSAIIVFSGVLNTVDPRAGEKPFFLATSHPGVHTILNTTQTEQEMIHWV